MVCPVHDVFLDGLIEQNRFLLNKADLLAQPLDIELVERGAVKANLKILVLTF